MNTMPANWDRQRRRTTDDRLRYWSLPSALHPSSSQHQHHHPQHPPYHQQQHQQHQQHQQQHQHHQQQPQHERHQAPTRDRRQLAAVIPSDSPDSSDSASNSTNSDSSDSDSTSSSTSSPNSPGHPTISDRQPSQFFATRPSQLTPPHHHPQRTPSHHLTTGTPSVLRNSTPARHSSSFSHSASTHTPLQTPTRPALTRPVARSTPSSILPSPSANVRLDRGAMAMLGYPRAPTFRKLDTPLCDYDATPISLNSYPHVNQHSTYYLPSSFSRHHQTPPSQLASSGSSSAPSSSVRSSAGLQKHTFTSRFIIDESLANQLGVRSRYARQDTHPVILNRSDPPDPDDDPFNPSSSAHSVTRDRHRLYSTCGLNDTRPSLLSVNSTPSVTQPAQQYHPTPQIQRPSQTQLSGSQITLHSRRSFGSTALQNTTVPHQHSDVHAPPPTRRSLSITALPPQLSDKPNSDSKFVPTPSNRRMEFHEDAAREVIPSDPDSSSSSRISLSTINPLLYVSLIAVESIWPHSSSGSHAAQSAGWTCDRFVSASTQSLLHFIKEVLRRSRTNSNTLKLALFYLHQSRRSTRERIAVAERARSAYDSHLLGSSQNRWTSSTSFETQPPGGLSQAEADRLLAVIKDPALSGRKMFLASLMCASKYLQDRNFSNRAWAKISGLPIHEVNFNERAFLGLLEYRLHVEVAAFDIWNIRLQKFMDEKQARPSEIDLKTATGPSALESGAPGRGQHSQKKTWEGHALASHVQSYTRHTPPFGGMTCAARPKGSSEPSQLDMNQFFHSYPPIERV